MVLTLIDKMKNGLVFSMVIWHFFSISYSYTASPIRIIAGGDVMLGSWVEDIIHKEGYDYPFRKINSLLSDTDIFFANLEAPFGTSDSAFEKTYTFHVSMDLVRVLTAGKINVVSLANNHIMDYGVADLISTTDILEKNNVHYTGAGINLQNARKPARLEIKGHKIIFAGYSLTFPEEFWATDSTPGTCFPSHSFFYKDIKNFKKYNDIVIVSFHWGGELLKQPKQYQIELAHNAINAGADLILGHHPHVVQGIEIFKNKIVAYSLGNFIFGSYSENVQESMLLELLYGTNGFEQCKVHPINVYNREVDFQPYFLEGYKRIQFLQNLQNLSLELNNSQDVFSDAGLIMF
jgi:poly-gamma-glutamate capsule biosynthesis protein CapA/YwtB (metallophosphatase superfamily)